MISVEAALGLILVLFWLSSPLLCRNLCVSDDGVIECLPCPHGGDCSPPTGLTAAQLDADADVVHSANIVSQLG